MSEDSGAATVLRSGLPQPIQAALALLGLLVSSPLWLAGGLAMKLTSSGPAIFRQQRVGRGGRRFVLLKLRTMSRTGAGPGFTSADDPRVTPVGSFLRRTKIDELPELWNIVRGDLALVGPRPEVPGYVDLSSPLWRRVLEVRPGVTDPVAIHLRDEEGLLAAASTDRERAYLELLQPYKLRGHLAYLERRTWSSDVRVLFHTVLAVLVPSLAPPPRWEDVVAASVEARAGGAAGQEGAGAVGRVGVDRQG